MPDRDEKGLFVQGNTVAQDYWWKPGQSPQGKHSFQPGVSGNPGGKTKEQKANEMEAARLGALTSLRMIQAVIADIEDAPDEAEHRARAKKHLTGDTLKLIKDVQDRAHGTPKQSLDMSNSDGSLTEMTAEQLLTKRRELEKRLGIASDGSAGEE